MAQSSRKQARSNKRSQQQQEFQPAERALTEATPRRALEPISAKTENQRRYINAIRNFQLVFGLGPAGTGKTYIAGAIAAEMLEAKKCEKIIITRPAVDAGESLGFLPGELEEKYEPYLAPLRAVLDERLGRSFVDYLLKMKKILPLPLAYMRGMTFDDCIVILDEAQNVTPAQMKMFLTRIGRNCTVVIDGDIEQKDIHVKSGLQDAVERIGYIPAVKVVKFGDSDIVRSGIVAEIIKAYRHEAIRPLQ